MSPGKKGGTRRRLDISIDEVEDGITVHAHIPDAAADVGMPEMAFNPDWLSFSPLEKDVLILLCDHGAMTARAIGKELDRSPEAQLKDVLANLGARRVLTTSQDGYALNLPGDRVAAFRDWLAAQT